jgi:serine/threonine protein kinase
MTIILPDRYLLTGVSGGGGMGDIYACTDTHLKRRVALKMLKDGGEKRRLLDEIKALIKLRSKHVVQLYDVITVKVGSVKKTALVLEHIEGVDLGIGSVAPGREHLYTLWQIASGLVDIHREGVIHRDIKPNNIRVDADNVVKILDFGLARDAGEDAQTMSIIGTPLYMAPELWRNLSVSFDQAIDVYAFGVMALTLINATIPDGLSRRPPVPPPVGTFKGIFTDMPDDVVEVLEQCIRREPEDRPSMKAVESILGRYLLYNKHRALLVLGSKTHEINVAKPNASIKSGDIGAIGISYDGLRFKVSSLNGTVFVNNMTIKVGDELPKCCVIGFGPKEASRSFVTFDVSNPEVMP